jgi:hypothetical protein
VISPRRDAWVQAFADYERLHNYLPSHHRVLGMPLGTRLHRIVRQSDHEWLLWLATNDFVFGTYLLLDNDGTVTRVTVRNDEGDEINIVRPSDDAIRRKL